MKQGPHTPRAGKSAGNRGLRSDPSAEPGRSPHTGARDVLGKSSPNARAHEAPTPAVRDESKLVSYYTPPKSAYLQGVPALLCVVSSRDGKLNHYYMVPAR